MRLYTDLYRTGGWTAVQKERRKKERAASRERERAAAREEREREQRRERERERSHLGNLKVKAQRAKEARALVLNSVERKPPPLPYSAEKRQACCPFSLTNTNQQPTTNQPTHSVTE